MLILSQSNSPMKDLDIAFETTYTEDTTRVQSGLLNLKPMFTVEALKYKASNVSVSEMYHLLQFVATGEPFRLHYFSPYYGEWRTAPFYVGAGDLTIGRLNENNEYYDEISFQMTGVRPIGWEG